MASSPFIVEHNIAMPALFWKSTTCLTPGEVHAFSPSPALLSAHCSQAPRGMFSSLRDPRVTDEPQRLYVCCHLQPGSDRAGCQSGAVRPTPEHSPSLAKPALPVSVVVSAHLFYFLCQCACIHSGMIAHFPGPRCPRQKGVNSAGQGSK